MMENQDNPIEKLLEELREVKANYEALKVLHNNSIIASKHEEALSPFDLRFSKLSNNIPGMIYQFMKRLDGTFCVPFSTPAIREIFGCSPEEVEDDFSPVAKVILPEDLDKVVSSIEISAQSMTIWNCEYRVQLPGQPIRWMHGQSTPERLADGSILWHGFNSDITAQKHTEFQLIRLNRAYAFLSEINEMIVRTAKLQELFKSTCKIAVSQGGYLMAWIGLPDVQALRVEPVAYSGKADGYLEKLLITLNDSERGQGPTASALQTGRHVVINDIATDIRMYPWRDDALKLGYRASAAFPLFVKSKVKGTLNLYSSEVNFFDDQELKVLDEMAADISFAMEFVENEEQRKQSEKALHESEEKFRGVFENSTVGKSMTAADGKLSKINRAFAGMLGYSIDELEGKGFENITHPDDVAESREMIRCLLAKEKSIYSLEKRYIHKDGSIVWAMVSTTLYCDSNGLPLYFITSIQDITDRKRFEEEIKQVTLNWNATFDSIQDGIALLDNRQKIIQSNHAFQEFTGKSPEELIGKNCFYFLHGTGCPIDGCPFVRMKASRTRETMELRLNGLVCEIMVDPILNENGEITGAVHIIADITERKKAEMEILELNRGLELRVAERTQELVAANKELEAFSYTISHDLKAPLRHIISFSDLILENRSPALSKEDLEFLNVISTAANDMGRLIDVILRFSRLNSVELKNDRINSSDMIHQVIKFFELETINRNVIFKIESLPDIQGDGELIRDAWTNLISNAIKYTGKKPEATIEIGSVSTSDEVTFFIKDNGAGFDMKSVEKLFGVFHRLHSSKDFEGIGIGLANVNRIITRHGGHCWAEGEVDKGATFYFTLPIIMKA